MVSLLGKIHVLSVLNKRDFCVCQEKAMSFLSSKLRVLVHAQIRMDSLRLSNC